jgi:formate--tetrahydrofolate ligase
LENNPAFVHGGPFANIAHGCNTVLATKTALKLADYVVTEAGFGADLGAEKFFDIKCRKAKLTPSVAVVVATIRAIKMHGGVTKEELNKENLKAVEVGLANLGRHLKNIAIFGVPAIVAVNNFTSDTEDEFQIVKNYCEGLGAEAILCKHWESGSSGAIDLATKVIKLTESTRNQFKHLYSDSESLWNKVNLIAKNIYGASEVVADKIVRDQFKNYEEAGYGKFPICMAKTQYSFSTDANLKGAPKGHVVQVREIRLSAGAEFVVVVTGEVMTMPGLPRDPAASKIGIDSDSNVYGLF